MQPEQQKTIEKVFRKYLSSPRWVGWKPNDGDVPDPKTNKISKRLVNARTGKWASHSNPADWSDYYTALQSVKEYNLNGIGVVFHGAIEGTVGDVAPLCGIDIDNCYDPVKKEFSALAARMMAKIQSYTEISPSGRGIKIFVRGEVNGSGGHKRDDIGLELYNKNRFFTLTGLAVKAQPEEIRDCTKQIKEIEEEFFSTSAISQAKKYHQRDFNIWQSIPDNVSRHDAIRDFLLFNVKPTGASWDAMYSMAKYIADQNQKGSKRTLDRDEITNIVNWVTDPIRDEEKKGTERAKTIQPHWELIEIADFCQSIQVDPIEWLWENVVARGHLVWLAAASEVGKSLLTVYLTFKMAAGHKLFGQFDVKQPKSVIYYCLEDSKRRVKQRVDDYRHEFEHNKLEIPFAAAFYAGINLTEEANLDLIEHQIESRQADFVILDTYQMATPGASSYDDEKHSLVLHRLRRITTQYNAAIIVIDHYRKVDSKNGNGNNPRSADDIRGSQLKQAISDTKILLDKNGTEFLWKSSCKDGEPLQFTFKRSAIGCEEGLKFTFDKFVNLNNTEKKDGRAALLHEFIRQECRNNWFSLADIQLEIFGDYQPSARTIQNYLKDMEFKRILKVEGSTKDRRYQLLEDLSDD